MNDSEDALIGQQSSDDTEDILQHNEEGYLSGKTNAAIVEVGTSKVNNRNVKTSEILFLIADFLKRSTPCQKAAEKLIEEIQTYELLDKRFTWEGLQIPSSYADFSRLHRDLPPTHLLNLLQQSNTEFEAKSDKNVIRSSSFLLKSRGAAEKMELTVEERKAMMTELIRLGMERRKISRSIRMAQNVLEKCEVMQKFKDTLYKSELPNDLQGVLARIGENQVPIDLAAEVRALRQLLHLRELERSLVTTAKEKILIARNNHMYRTYLRTGKNLMNALRRRELSNLSNTNNCNKSMPAFVYSRYRKLKVVNGHLQIPVYCLTYDKEGKYVITGADDRLIKVWSLHTGSLQHTLRGHNGNITDLSVSHANTMLASSSDDKTVRIWELCTGAPVAVLVGHSSVVNCVRFHPSLNVAVTASDDGKCFCYKLPSITSPPPGSRETRQQTAQRLITANAFCLSLRPTYSLTHRSDEHRSARSSKVLCLAFSRCGKFVVTGGQDGIGRVWDMSPFSDLESKILIRNEAMQGFAPRSSAPNLDIDMITQENSTASTQDIVESHETDAFDGADLSFDSSSGDIDPVPSRRAVLPATNDNFPIDSDRSRIQLQPPQHLNDNLWCLNDSSVPALPNNDPVAYMKGHTGPITNILFSHDGSRVATASIKDGTTRIWSWSVEVCKTSNSDAKDLDHMVLLANDVPDLDGTGVYCGSARPRGRKSPAVDTLCWTKDDRRLITLHSIKPETHEDAADWAQRIRIWDPIKGTEIFALAAVDDAKNIGHVNAVFALDVHPNDWRVAVTAGYDGRICVWDISTGRLLRKFTNQSAEGECAALLDGGFMPDGSGFCFTDRLGRLLIFGTGSGGSYAATPVEQYFKCDYAALETDRFFNVIDRETQISPWLMESGPLVDIYRSEYTFQPPHLLLRTLDRALFEQHRHRRVKQAIELAIKSGVPPLNEDINTDDEDFPCAVLERRKLCRSGSLKTIHPASYRLNGQRVYMSDLPRRTNSRVNPERNISRRSLRNHASIEERDTSILQLEISSDDESTDEDFQVPQGGAGSNDADSGEDDEEDDDLNTDHLMDLRDDSDDDRSYRSVSMPRRLRSNRRNMIRELQDNSDSNRRFRRRRNVPPARVESRLSASVSRIVVDTSSQSSASSSERNPQDVTSHASTPESPVDALSLVVESNDGICIGDNQLDEFDRTLTYDQMLAERQEENDAQDAGNLIVCAFCGEGDDGGILKLYSDSMGEHPLILGPQRVFVHEQCAIASPLCFHRDDKWYNVTKEIRRGRKLECCVCHKKGATIGCAVSECRRSYHWKCAVTCGWSLSEVYFFCPQHKRVHQRASAEATAADFVPASQRLGLQYHREWLQQTDISSKQQYVPQVGDYVVYLPQGHEAYMRCFAIYGNAMSTSQIYSRLACYYAIKCKVTDAQYVFPSAKEYGESQTIKCIMTLAILATSKCDTIEMLTEEEKLDINHDEIAAFSALHSERFSSFVSVDEDLRPCEDDVATRCKFTLLYHSHDVANFLVLEHIYMNGVDQKWQVNDRVETPFVILDQHGTEIDCKISVGTVVGIDIRHCNTERIITSPYECICVRWDDADAGECYVSPWELEPIAGTQREQKKRRDRRRNEFRNYRARCIMDPERQALLNEITSVMELSIAHDFLDPVDDTFMDYLITVANPINLTQIRERIQLGYYRQVEALIADLKLLSSNCELYNVETSTIAQNARTIYNRLLTDIQRLYPDLREQHNDERNILQYPIFLQNDSDSSNQEMDALQQMHADRTPPVTYDSGSQGEMQIERSAEDQVELPALEDPASAVSDASELESVANDSAESMEDIAVTESCPESSSESSDVKSDVEADISFELLTFNTLLQTLSREQRNIFRTKCLEDLKYVLSNVHEALMAADTQDVFTSAVTEEVAPKYFQYIEHPMDFGTMQDRLQTYSTFSSYCSDMSLVFSNAVQYNGASSEIAALVKELQQLVVKVVADLVNEDLRKKKQIPKSRALRSQNGIKKLINGKRSRSKPAKENAIIPNISSNDEEASWESKSASDDSLEDNSSEEDWATEAKETTRSNRDLRSLQHRRPTRSKRRRR